MMQHITIEKEYMMKFINVRLLVDHFPATMKFWRDMMGFKLTYSDETVGYAYFETDSAGVELLSREGFATTFGDVAATSRQTIMVFQVDDIDTMYADLVQRGATVVNAPRDIAALQIRTAHISDPEGNLVELYSKPGKA
jgi:lactoylglutathione lyase